MVELVVTLLIGSILLAWGIPNYRDFKIRKQIVDVANEVVYSMTLARAEAVRYGTDVRVRPVGGDWQNGWTITSIGVDGNANVLLAQEAAVDDNLTFEQVGPLAGDLVFTPFGGLDGPVAGRFEIKNDSVTGFDRAVNISLTGSSRVVEL